MTMVQRVCAVFTAALMIFALGCASSSKQQSTGSYLDDSVITTKVKSAILGEPSLSVTDIKVETDEKVVKLSGIVESQAAMNKAIALARAVPGVTSVKNDLRVK
jgi:osmotically-inducible protein OsmY